MRSSILALAALSAAPSLVAASDAPIQTLWVPLPEQELLSDIFDVINPEAASPVNTIISVAVSTDDTVIYYDHHEDGYEADVMDIQQSSTEVWGDGDASNGCAPIAGRACNDANDHLKAGDVALLESKVYLPRNNQKVLYDGSDVLYSSRPVAMTRTAYPSGKPGSMMAGAVEVIEQGDWGLDFIAPVGQDVSHGTNAYQFTGLAIMAGEAGTWIKKNGQTVKTDANKWRFQQGDAKVIRVNQGDRITSDKPIQVHLITGDIGSTYELRWYSLAPTEQWGTTAYAPVGDTKGKVRVTVFNPSNSAITVKFETRSGSSNMSVPAKKHAVSPIIPDDKAAKFSSSSKFYAFSSTDTDGSGQIFDWGYPLMTEEQLTNEVLIGLGYGCTDNDCGSGSERSVVWVTCVDDAEIWMDFDNDGTVDKHTSCSALESIVAKDVDQDMSGASIWATKSGSQSDGEGVKMAAAWGQKASLSGSNDLKALDLGTVVVPFVGTRTSCSVEILEDNDGDGVMSPGDVVEEIITVIHIGQSPVGKNTLSVETLGGIVTVEPVEEKGGTQVYRVSYTIPEGEMVKESCELIPYVPPTVTPEPTAAPTDPPTAAPTDPPTEAPVTPPPAPDAEPKNAPPSPTGAKGDPHFRTFGGEMYDFHGECDLVLLHNPEFKAGLGMDIHIRTKIEDFWSSIESSAVKIGDDILEIRADPNSNEWLWLNGNEIAHDAKEGEWHVASLAGFKVRYQTSKAGKFGGRYGGVQREAVVYLKGHSEYIMYKTYNNFVRVDVNWEGSDNYVNSVGMLGSHAHEGKRLGRDGRFIENVNNFGQEWQVRPEVDGKLFHSDVGAVIDDKCVMPPAYNKESAAKMEARRRRLGEAAVDTAMAEKACANHADAEDKAACVFDVLATQDLNLASVW